MTSSKRSRDKVDHFRNRSGYWNEPEPDPQKKLDEYIEDDLSDVAMKDNQENKEVKTNERTTTSST